MLVSRPCGCEAARASPFRMYRVCRAAASNHRLTRCSLPSPARRSVHSQRVSHRAASPRETHCHWQAARHSARDCEARRRSCGNRSAQPSSHDWHPEFPVSRYSHHSAKHCDSRLRNRRYSQQSLRLSMHKSRDDRHRSHARHREGRNNSRRQGTPDSRHSQHAPHHSRHRGRQR
jgi:hypothetical protein